MLQVPVHGTCNVFNKGCLGSAQAAASFAALFEAGRGSTPLRSFGISQVVRRSLIQLSPSDTVIPGESDKSKPVLHFKG